MVLVNVSLRFMPCERREPFFLFSPATTCLYALSKTSSDTFFRPPTMRMTLIPPIHHIRTEVLCVCVVGITGGQKPKGANRV